MSVCVCMCACACVWLQHHVPWHPLTKIRPWHPYIKTKPCYPCTTIVLTEATLLCTCAYKVISMQLSMCTCINENVFAQLHISASNLTCIRLTHTL